MKRTIEHTVVRTLALGLVVGVSVILAFSPTPSAADGGVVIPPEEAPYDEWAAAWWQWTWSVPAPANPVADPTGNNAKVHQPAGDVWFLAGSFGGTAERTCTLPPGKALFFPIVNWTWVTVPEDCPGEDPWEWFPANEEWIRDLMAGLIDMTEDRSCEVDGVPVPIYREQSVVFDVKFSGNNLWGIPAGTYGPAVDDGYYVMLAPLSAGTHTIRIRAALPSTGWSLDVTYTVTVAAGQK